MKRTRPARGSIVLRRLVGVADTGVDPVLGVAQLEGIDADDPPTVRRLGVLVVRDADGAEQRVVLDNETRWLTRRKVAGPWNEVAKHALGPVVDRAVHPDGHVALVGGWVRTGEAVIVQSAHGGRTVRAVRIAVGATAARDMRLAELWLRVRDAPWDTLVPWATRALAVAQVGVGVWFAATERPWNALAMFFGVLVTLWPTVTLRAFPGGAMEDDEVPTFWPWANFCLWAGVGGIVLWPGHPAPEGLLPAAIGVFEAFTVVQLLYAQHWRPHATPGPQIALPANPAVRYVLVYGVTIIWVLCVVGAFVHDWMPDDVIVI